MAKLRKAQFKFRFNSSGFTLLELVVVISIIGIASVLLLMRSDAYSYWKEESFLRRFVETIQFLHHQAVQDGEYYQLEINFKEHFYRVGVFKEDPQSVSNLPSGIDPNAGTLSLELATFLNPNFAQNGSIIPPPSFPSLAETQPLPEGMLVESVKTMLNGELDEKIADAATVLFSPRGFSEFAVIHLSMSDGSPVTVLLNPFTGLSEIYRDKRDFEWTYAAKSS